MLNLADEREIVWCDDPKQYRYVRAVEAHLANRIRPPGKQKYSGRLIGYATLKPDARGTMGIFSRRIFILFPRDWPNPGPYQSPGVPSEGVDPLTLRPGYAGEATSRAESRDPATL